MDRLKNYLRNVYEGLYYYSVKHAPHDSSPSVIHFRLIVSFFPYYASIIILLTGARVHLYGPYKPSFLSVAFVTFGGFFLLYRLFIYPLLDLSDVDKDVDALIKASKIKKGLTFFGGGLVSMVIAFFLVFLLYHYKPAL